MKKLKAFTLIELIVAMAVFAILMTGIMNMVEPISKSATHAKVVNEQKNVENAICEYIGENMRLATNLCIVKGGSPTNAIDKFIAAKPVDVYGTVYKDADKKNVKLICFDPSIKYTFSHYTPKYGGRMIRKVDGTPLTAGSFDQAACTPNGSGSYYMVLGEDYYQQADYYLSVEMKDQFLTLNVTSDYYLSATAKTNNPNAKSSSSANAVQGVYEMKAYQSKPMEESMPFVFKIIDSGGSDIASKKIVSSPTAVDPIYFVFTTEDIIAE